MFKSVRTELRLGSSACALFAALGAASAQTASPTPAAPTAGAGTVLPDITVRAPKQTPRRIAVQKRTNQPNQPTAAPAPLTPEQVQLQANQQVVKQTSALDAKRDEVLQPKTGTALTVLTQQDLENVPQGGNIAVSDLVYQFPGVSQDSTSAGDFHVRNDHANVQFRINGIQMPDGVSGFSQFLDTGLFKDFSLITGALPAQYGLHQTGVLDITTKSGAALSGGNVSVYGGSNGTFTPSFEYGGVKGNTEYFVTGRFFTSNLGLENTTGAINADHDHTDLGRFFSYTSTLIDPNTRFVTFAGVSDQAYQIPTNPGLSPAFPAFGVNNFSSTQINENQYEKNEFFVAALQRSVGDVDAQISYFNRYSELHFVPDPVGDLVFNGIDTDVLRRTFVNGIQGDFAYKLNDAHTLRTGIITQVEQSKVATISTVEPLDMSGNAIDTPVNITDSDTKLGAQLGLYAQDEWKLTHTLTLNYGLRFDQMWQYVNANQVSPRASLQWQPWWSTVIHIGYAREFTPPDQDLGRVSQPQLLNGTTGAVPVANSGPILPERSDVYDVGIVQQLLPKCPTGSSGFNCPALEVGVDGYYKYAQDLIDDGQFGQATILSAFNYAKGMVEGLEFKAKYKQGNFTFYTNWSTGWEKATDPVSNQSFFDQATLYYLQNNWIYTDHTQLLTGSAGASYLFTGTDYSWLNDAKISTTMIYGSGLRADGGPVTVMVPGVGPETIPVPNGGHVPAYTQVNLGLSKEFKDSGWDPEPFTLRFDIVNLFDQSYQIRNGSGIGVFASQYGPRRGYFFGFSQKLGAPTYASDLAVKAAPAPAAVYKWTGFYAGANVGAAFNSEDVTTPLGAAPIDPSGALGGFQAGYNFQFAPSWLAGIEGEFDWTYVQGTANIIGSSPTPGTGTALAINSQHNWYGTLSGRLGYVAGPWLFFAKGGAAWLNASDQLSDTTAGIAEGSSLTSTRSGWTAGLGVEYQLTPKWSAKVEYDYLDFGSSTLGLATPVGGGTTFNTQVNEIKLGLNYHFSGL